MDWFRWHHGTATDPKWRVIARKAGVRISDVMAVWCFVLEAGSQSSERGTVESWDHEDIAAALDMDAEQVEAIWNAMQGKTLDGSRLTGWEKRQPKREDDGAAERKRRQRDRGRESVTEGDVTQCHAASRSVTIDKIREEKKTIEADASMDATASDEAGKPEDLKARIFGPALEWFVKATSQTEVKARKVLGKWCSDHGDGITLQALQNAARAGPIDPIPWITTELKRLTGNRTHGETDETEAERSAARVAAVLARRRISPEPGMAPGA